MSISTLPTVINPSTVASVFSFDDIPLLVDTATPTSTNWVIGPTVISMQTSSFWPSSTPTITTIPTAHISNTNSFSSNGPIQTDSIKSEQAAVISTFPFSGSLQQQSLSTYSVATTSLSNPPSSPTNQVQINSATLIESAGMSLTSGIEVATGSATKLPVSSTMTVSASNSLSKNNTDTVLSSPAHDNSAPRIAGTPNRFILKSIGLMLSISFISSCISV